jgi:hypothetical protein
MRDDRRPPHDRFRRPDNRHRDDRSRGSQNPNQHQNQGNPQNAPPVAPRVRAGDPTPFELFCAYHLGIARDGKYKLSNIHVVARQFNKSTGELKQLLQNYGLDSMTVMETDFDLAMAQVDIQLAPDGINPLELAKPMFEEFLKAPRKRIDWKKIIEEDIRENAKIFGRRD